MTKLAQLKAVYDELAKKQLKVGFFEHSKYRTAHLSRMWRRFRNLVIRPGIRRVRLCARHDRTQTGIQQPDCPAVKAAVKAISPSLTD
ncbi:hypothetical protein WKR00_15195 [Morganella morganii]